MAYSQTWYICNPAGSITLLDGEPQFTVQYGGASVCEVDGFIAWQDHSECSILLCIILLCNALYPHTRSFYDKCLNHHHT